MHYIWNNLVYSPCHHVCTIYLPLSAWLCLLRQFGLSDISIVSESNFLISCGLCFMTQVILSMFSNSISGIPSSAGSPPGTTKNLHLTHLSLCLIFTVHVPSCSMFNWLYVFKTMVLFLWCLTWPLWILETEFLLIWMALSCHHFQCLFYILF